MCQAAATCLMMHIWWRVLSALCPMFLSCHITQRVHQPSHGNLVRMLVPDGQVMIGWG